MDNNRIEKIVELGRELKNSGGNLRDIRYREWLNYNSKVSQAVLYIINAENILGELDDFSLENDQCYPEIEEFYNEIAALRATVTKYVDEHPDILEVVGNNLNK